MRVIKCWCFCYGAEWALFVEFSLSLLFFPFISSPLLMRSNSRVSELHSVELLSNQLLFLHFLSDWKCIIESTSLWFVNVREIVRIGNEMKFNWLICDARERFQIEFGNEYWPRCSVCLLLFLSLFSVFIKWSWSYATNTYGQLIGRPRTSHTHAAQFADHSLSMA